jgi:hypothetical protein
MNKRERKRKKKIQLQNKKLLKRYPFLWPSDWLGNPIQKRCYDYTWTWVDDMPIGWKKAFGKMLCEELRNELVKYHAMSSYKILQVKEKYGGLRWYDVGSVGNTTKIIDAYSHLSENICIVCGKPDVPMINDGWMSPWCFDCWKKCKSQLYKKYSDEELLELYDSFSSEDHMMEESYLVRQYNSSGSTETVYDISSTAQKIRSRYRARCGA